MDYNSPTENGRKRKRLTNACNRCRSRKVRCDTRLPHCTNCVKAGAQCITLDLRQPHLQAERREAQSQDLSSHNHQATNSHTIGCNLERGSTPEQANTSSSLVQDDPDPSHHSPVGLLPALPRFSTGNSLYILTQWLDLAFARLGSPQRFSHGYRHHGNRQLLKGFSPYQQEVGMVNLSTSETQSAYERLHETIGPIFPSLTQRRLDGAESTDLEVPNLLQTMFDNLVGAITSLPGQSAAFGAIKDCISQTISHLGLLTLDRSIGALRILILSGLVLRSCDQVELAWNIISLTVAIAHTTGLHRRSSKQTNDDVLTWWALYVLEKTLCLELERASTIRDHDCNQVLPVFEPSRQGSIRLDCLCAVIGLAKVQSQVSERLIQSRALEESPTSGLQHAIREKMRIVGELDLLINDWVEQLPTGLRPNEYLYCEQQLIPAVIFLALQYHQTLFLLHRHALVLNTERIRDQIDQYFADQPWKLRLRNGHNICRATTRAIVNILSYQNEIGAYSILNTGYAPLLAIYGLAIQIVRHPTAGAVKADLELQATAIRISAAQYELHLSHGLVDPEEDKVTRELLTRLHELVSSYLARPNTAISSTDKESTTPHSSNTTHYSSTANIASRQESNAPGDAEQLRHLNTTRRLPETSRRTIAQDDLIVSDFALSWPPLLLGNTDPCGGYVEGSETDWDAFAYAFDLPL